MDLLYATTLLVALAGGVAAGVAAALERWGARERRWTRVIQVAAGAAWVALVVSFLVHLGWGHTPGEPAALPVHEFVLEHKSFVAAALLPGAALLLRRRERVE